MAYGNPIFGTVKESNPVVDTIHGKVQGENRNGIAIFRGIPYGGNCDGKSRFLPSVPAADWTGVLDCTKNGYYAMQFGTSISGAEGLGPYFSGGKPELFGVADEKQHENCLVLNVVTPGIDHKKRPVLVYLHGGGFSSGSGTLVLGSDPLAREEDLVIVGVNHRLNVFGYLYLGAFDKKYADSGMAGMLDLVLALEWVRDNIGAFGGDPEKVTIMGESGGGMKVSVLLAMEKAKGLFRAAIVESGSFVVGRASAEQGAEIAKKLLDKLGISPDELDKLTDLSAKDILEAAHGDAEMDFGPVADGINLNYNPTDEFFASEVSAFIPLLVGSSEDEMAVFTPSSTFDITWASLRDALAGANEGLLEDLSAEEKIDRMINVFKETDRKNNSADHLYLKIVSLSSFLGGGAFYQAQAKAKQGTASVYHYLVSFDAPLPAKEDRKFAWHTADLPLQMRIILHPECEEISKVMARAWAAFVRTGSPSTEELVWPEFTLEEKKVMVFDDVCRVEADPLKEMREVIEGL
ncbi:carboxylesterase/lipase family protein [Paenibacillus nasutitermitis]|uniref:Carboxylic ester hydrolase n=1 Tax=Paenibacillus nasutitermitis TaxID=1652958 RepID=A0A916ZE00_9BACL|nr:carboxylesterase family protein [Paenibacillus nasutitermitis]GGD88808.1 carboxylic ester hydrolase [Paenibacillus nasutitermitis]